MDVRRGVGGGIALLVALLFVLHHPFMHGAMPMDGMAVPTGAPSGPLMGALMAPAGDLSDPCASGIGGVGSACACPACVQGCPVMDGVTPSRLQDLTRRPLGTGPASWCGAGLRPSWRARPGEQPDVLIDARGYALPARTRRALLQVYLL